MLGIDIGKTIYAIDPCYMDGDYAQQTLTVGEGYDIFSNDGFHFEIIDDSGDVHGFDVEGFDEFFVLSQEEVNDNIPETTKFSLLEKYLELWDKAEDDYAFAFSQADELGEAIANERIEIYRTLCKELKEMK